MVFQFWWAGQRSAHSHLQCTPSDFSFLLEDMYFYYPQSYESAAFGCLHSSVLCDLHRTRRVETNVGSSRREKMSKGSANEMYERARTQNNYLSNIPPSSSTHYITHNLISWSTITSSYTSYIYSPRRDTEYGES